MGEGKDRAALVGPVTIAGRNEGRHIFDFVGKGEEGEKGRWVEK